MILSCLTEVWGDFSNALHMLVFSSDWCGAIDLEVTAYNAIDSSWTVITA